MRLEVIVLAAGEGTRMQSSIPKVLHTVGGRPLLDHVLCVARGLAPEALHVVVGRSGDEIRARFEATDVVWVDQMEQKGTGHAVMQAIDGVQSSAMVLVLFGDVPLIEQETLEACISAAEEGIGVVTVDMPVPDGFGRIQRGRDGEIEAIVEHSDVFFYDS